MAVEPQRTPGLPGSSDEHVKPHVQADAVPDDWLNEPEHARQADAVDRLEADVELVTALALAGYQGPDWEYFSLELVKYGVAVLTGWMRRDMILAKCRQRGIGLAAFSRPFEDDEIEELVGETIAKALMHFRRDVLVPRRWDHRKGASLRTYFIGQCLMRFANIYRMWWTHETRLMHTSLLDDPGTMTQLGATVDGPEDQTVAWSQAVTALGTVKDERVTRAMILTAAGRTQAEIANQLGVSEKTVERMIGNERDRQRQRRAG